MKTLYVGIDIAKDSFTVAYWSGETAIYLGQLTNDATGFARLGSQIDAVKQAQGVTEVQLVAEPTGGYELALTGWAYAHSWLVSLPNPKQVRRWAQGRGKRAKTDKQDACLLAEYGGKEKPLPQDHLPAEVRQLDTLLRRRDDVEKLLRSERNRHHALIHQPGIPAAVLDSVKRIMAALEAELEALEQAIQDLLQQQPGLKSQVRHLRTIPGVGPKNVLPILVLLYRWQALTRSQGTSKGLCAFLGLDPQPHSSGSSVWERPIISRMGDRAGRRLLYLGALGGVRGHNPLRAFYQQLLGRGKAPKLALVAAARKILVWAWAIFRTNKPFDASHFRNSAAQPS